MPATKFDLQSLRKDKRALMVLGIVLTVVTFLSGTVVTPLLEGLGWNTALIRPIVRSVVGVGCMVALGGGSWLRFDLKKIRDAWHYARVLVMINIVIGTLMGGLAVLIMILEGQITAGQLGYVVQVTVLSIFVGINEEVMFRGLMFGGLLAGLGNRKSGPLLAALISSLAFGFAHVIFDIDYGSLLGIAQGLMKTLECGMFAFILCVPTLEGRNIIGAMTVHAFFDWILLVARTSQGALPTGNYVIPNERGAIAAIVIWAVFCVLYLPKCIQSARRFNAMKLPQYGPFVAESQSAQLANTAWNDEKEYQAQPHEGAVDARIGSLRDHKLFNHKVKTILATLVCFMMMSNIVSVIALAIFGQGMASKVVASLGNAAVSLVMLLGFQRHFGGRPSGLLAWTTTGLLLALPALGLALANAVDWPGATFNNPLVALALALAPGFSEEIIIRSIPASNWMRVSGEKRDVIMCVVVTSLTFSLVHAINLLAGAAFSTTIFQMFYAFCMGVLLCTVFLSTGSVWPSVIMHTIVDFTAYLTMDMSLEGVLSQELTLGLPFWLALVTCVAMLAWTAWLLRPAQQVHIVERWKKSWRSQTAA